MMTKKRRFIALAALALTNTAWAQQRIFDVPATDAVKAIPEFARQAGLQIVAPADRLNGITTPAIKGSYDARAALKQLLLGTGLEIASDDGAVITLRNVAAEKTTALGSTASASLDEVVVTGSHLRGGSEAYPVTFIDRQQLDRGTATSVSDVLQQLPQNFSAFGVQGGGTQFNGGVNNYYAAVAPDLHGLGPQATLTLINGLRVPPTSLAGGQFVDVSLIPLVAIERIEVLSDTASGSYGSDAIAGAVNFVLRRNYEGAETGMKFGSATRGGYSEKTVSQLVGTSWESGGASVALEWQENSALTASERRFRRPGAPGSALDAETIIPEISHYSGLISFDQEIQGAFELSGWALVSRRDTKPVFGSTVVRVDETRTDVVTGAFTLQRALPRDWQLRASAGGLYSTLDDVAVLGNTQVRHTKDKSTNIDLVVEGGLEVLGRRVRTALGFGAVSLTHDEPTTVPVVGDRDVRSGYAEIGVPLLPRLDLSASVRHDRYSDFGGTTNEKFGLAWSPAEGIKLRTSYGTAFRAPPLFDVYGPQEGLHIIFPDPQAPSGESNQLWLSTANPGLRPEEAEGYTLGADLDFASRFGGRLSITYYHYDYQDRINSPGFAGLYLSDPDLYAPYIIRNPSPSQVQAVLEAVGPNFYDLAPPFDPAAIAAILDQRDQNLTRQVTEGIDLAVNVVHPLAVGELDAGLDVAYILKSDVTFIPGSAPATAIDVFQRPVDLRVRGTLGWTRGVWRVMTGINYSGSYIDNTSAEVKPIGDWTTVDLKGTYSAPAEAHSLLRGTSISVSVRNVFDADPPALPESSSLFAQFGYDPANADAMGRLAILELKKSW